MKNIHPDGGSGQTAANARAAAVLPAVGQRRDRRMRGAGHHGRKFRGGTAESAARQCASRCPGPARRRFHDTECAAGMQGWTCRGNKGSNCTANAPNGAGAGGQDRRADMMSTPPAPSDRCYVILRSTNCRQARQGEPKPVCVAYRSGVQRQPVGNGFSG
jgi:hypothetical protein